MMAACVAAEHGARVLLLEKNPELGRKLAITGGGRCNITNTEPNLRTLLGNYGEADKFLFSAFDTYGVQDTIDFFGRLGLPVKSEALNRAFPVSEKAPDVVAALVRCLKQHNVEVMMGADVQTIEHSDGEVSAVVVDGQQFRAKNYILATGGRSRPETGSTGDGFKWLADMGHTVNEPTPNVTPLATKEDWPALVAGTSLSDVKVHFYLEERKSFTATGKILFTHFGISGPTILNSAYKVAELLPKGEVKAYIDCYPTQDEQVLDKKVIDVLSEHPAKQLKNTLRYICPDGFAKAIVEVAGKQIDLDVNNSEVSRTNRLILVRLLKALPLTIDKLMGFEKAVVADGGVDLKDIDTRTMRSRKISNLFVTGDLLDINRPSGGFSLQLCWTSGYVAGANFVD